MIQDEEVIASINQADLAAQNIPALIANKKSRRNTSGVKGVSYDRNRNKWSAEIMFQRKRYRLGRYDTLEKAAKVRKEAEDQLHGDFLDWYNSRQ